jgi:glucokinase
MARKVLAFDIGGTSIRAAIVENNKIKRLLSCGTPKEKKLFLEKIVEFADELIDKSIKGIGVGCAGVIKNGVVKNSPNLPIDNFDLQLYLERKYKRRVKVFNDAGCFSLAEYRIGCKKKDFVIITLGTGIGGGIIINNEPYDGTGYGGELGHIRVNSKDWESLWKGTRKSIYKEFKKDVLIKDLVKKRDLKSKKILEKAGDYLGQGIASIISILDPEVVVLAGGPSEAGDSFLSVIKLGVEKYTFLPKKTPVVWTKLKHPGILGASLLVS